MGRRRAEDLAFPNGMVVTPDDATLIVAESYGNRLTAFDIGAGGALSNRRVWADLGEDHPDGICLDAEGAVWAADVGNKHCVRVREGGQVLQTVDADRGCFACALGGAAGRTPYIVTAQWPSDCRRPKVRRVTRSRSDRMMTLRHESSVRHAARVPAPPFGAFSWLTFTGIRDSPG